MTHDDAIQTVKQFCKLAASYNATHFHAEYDGSGDSGDMDIHVTVSAPPNRVAGAGIREGLRVESVTEPFRQWLDRISALPQTLITKQAGDTFKRACFELLPMGWEINDGSYGEVIVEVVGEKITIEHNERYMEVRNETFNF